MNRNEIRSAIAFFFDVIEGEHPSEDREVQLQLALDKLALATHFADFIFDETDYPDAPTREYAELRDLVSPNFPDCGYYNVAHNISTEIGEGSTSVGDAIDDICDIARDMEEVLWCW